MDLPLATELKCLLRRRGSQIGEHEGYDLGELAHFLIVQAGDDLAYAEATLGFSPLANLVDGARYRESDFTPSWECIEEYGGWFELTFVLSDDGYGAVLFVEEAEDVDPELLSLCREYSDEQRRRPMIDRCCEVQAAHSR
ncbi:hypothetical protein ACFOMD_17245 [Sphingoaurantiacus capsulatus]|uniref:Uncharacterized protein n=1 Tax=Sphingoaurantiacus capsulatus TaxID=1771310 RepID=A0ABV7XEZ7_9SPHN